MNDSASPKPHDTVRSQLRIPAGLHQQLLEATAKSGRSMNAEIVQRLEQSFVPRAFKAPGTLGLRAEIAGQREINQATVDMLARSMGQLHARKQEGADYSYPGQASGKSVEQALADTKNALETFQGMVDAATLLLSELAVSEVVGGDIDVNEFRERARRAGVISG